jgi:hypothetical protein
MVQTVATLLSILSVAKAFSVDDTTVLNFALNLEYLGKSFDIVPKIRLLSHNHSRFLLEQRRRSTSALSTGYRSI